MKHLLFISALLIMLVSCKKESTQNAENVNYLNGIKLQLKDSLSSSDFQHLDFTNTVKTSIPDSRQIFLRIPFINKSLASDFILLQIENDDHFSSAKIFNINQNIQSVAKKPTQFNGDIQIYSLKRNLLTNSLINNGFIDAFHNQQNNSNPNLDIAVVIIPLMPEVIIVCSSSGGGYTYGNYYNLMSLYNGGGSGGGFQGGGSMSSGGYYNNSYSTPTINNHPTSGGGGINNPPNNNSIYINSETGENLPAINVNQYVKCFGNIPDNGATCSIKLLTDIPVNNDPSKFFDWSTGSPGHTFIQLTKSNGSQMVQQNIGFYPDQGWKTIITPSPVNGKFVDNAYHEFNASISMTLDADKFQSTLTHIQYLSNFMRYDIANYNCTDFALEIFNYRRGGGNQLTIPMYDLPGNTAPNGSATPQGVYQKLKEMQSNNSADAPNITIPGVSGFAGASDGPCN